MTAQDLLKEIGLDPKNYPNLSRYETGEYLKRVLEGIAKASKSSLKTAAQNLELDLRMM